MKTKSLRSNPPEKNKFLALKALLTGKFLQRSLSDEARDALEKAGLSGRIDSYLIEWETSGIVIGYVPVLSEKGLRYFDALKTLYGDDGTSVEDAQ